MPASAHSGVLPEVLADRVLQGQTAIHHIELAGPPFRRAMFHKEGETSWGPAGQSGEVSFFYILTTIFIYASWKSNEAKGTPNVSITIKHGNESRRYASNLKTKSFTFKYHTTPKNTKYYNLKFNNQRLKNKSGKRIPENSRRTYTIQTQNLKYKPPRVVSPDELVHAVEFLLQLQYVVDGGVAEDTDTRCQLLHQLGILQNQNQKKKKKMEKCREKKSPRGFEPPLSDIY